MNQNDRLINNMKNTIESLRMGVVPRKNIEKIHVGRDTEINEFKEILYNIKTSEHTYVKFIEGAYGQGKSFFLTYIHRLAYNDNFVVSKISLNDSIQLNNIDLVYRGIMKNLLCKSGKGIENILDNWIVKIKNEAERIYDSENSEKQKEFINKNINNDLKKVREVSGKLTNAIEKYYENKYLDHNSKMFKVIIEWLTGENIDLRKFVGLGVERLDKNNALEYLKALSIFIKSIGYSGFVVLFDELESIEDITKQNSRKIAYDNIRGFIDNSGKGEYMSTLFVFTLTPEFYLDERKGIASFEPLYTRLKKINTGGHRNVKSIIIELPNFDKNNLIKLTQNIQNIHNQAYDWDSHKYLEEVFDEIINNKFEEFEISSINIRDYTRDIVNKLDVLKDNNGEFENNPEKVLDLFMERVNEDEIDW